MMKPTISVSELKQKLADREPVYLLDVRTPQEHAAFNIGGRNIPLDTLDQFVDQIPTDTPIVVYCRSGRRSQVAVEMLDEAGIDAQNLIGGMLAWQEKNN